MTDQPPPDDPAAGTPAGPPPDPSAWAQSGPATPGAPPPPYAGVPGFPPPQPSRFKGSSVVWGALLSLVIPFFWLPLSLLVAGWLSGAGGSSAAPAIAAFLLMLLVPLVPGGLLAARGRTPSERGMGLGLLIGWGAIAIVGGGLCIAILSQF